MKLMAKNLAIAASAGSGKTYNLAHRYIGLLARDASPERIVALTFSRKAAAEIFSSVIAYLARAAREESAAAAVGALLGAPYPRARALADLKRLLAGLHRLTVGTLDSFAIRILQSFPLHFHLGGGFAIIDDNPGTAHFLQRQVIMRLLSSSGDSEAFRTAFRQASFGREERRLSTLLAEFIADCQDLYLEQPEAAFWGVPPVPGWGPDGADPAADGAALLALVEPQVKPALLARWQRFVEEVAAFDPAVPLPRPLEYLLTKACEVMPELLSGRAALAMERCTVELDENGCRLLTGLLRRVFDAELTAAAARARGIHRLVADYETAYERLIRRRGQLTYYDVQRLLARERFQRPDIDARLDASLDHWLLDEFQDTSTLQWLMLANLADEVIQDDDPGRSFFYV
ncbi:MAG: UvrD-helicase domain-containing protein, partial [Thermodesulfobacteriota bacterium]